MTNGTIQRQQRLIEVITAGLAEIDVKAGMRPAWNGANYDAVRAYDRRRATLMDEFRELLTKTEAARFTEKPPHGFAVTLADFRASSTSGWDGAFLNWRAGARRRLGMDTGRDQYAADKLQRDMAADPVTRADAKALHKGGGR